MGDLKFPAANVAGPSQEEEEEMENIKERLEFEFFVKFPAANVAGPSAV